MNASLPAAPAPYRPQCAWPAQSEIRCGESGLVVSRSSAGSAITWFCEARLPALGRTFHGDGVTPSAAELECFARFQRATLSVATHRAEADALAG